MESPIGSAESADSPDGRSTDTTHVGNDGLNQSGDGSVEPGSKDGIDNQVAVAQLGEVQLPSLTVGHFDHGQPEATENLEVRSRVAAHVGDTAQQEDRDVDPTLQQRSGDDKPVASVVAASTEHGHMAFEQVAVDGLHGGHDLPARILHQHERRNADVFDRAPIGLTHLCGVQYAHVKILVSQRSFEVDRGRNLMVLSIQWRRTSM